MNGLKARPGSPPSSQEETLVVSVPGRTELHVSAWLTDGYRAAIGIRFSHNPAQQFVWFSEPLKAPAHQRGAEARRLLRAVAAALLRA